MRYVDIKEKTVLDLGCSGGYFSFRLSESARYVLGVDADEEIIKRNIEIAEKQGYRNVTFIHAMITPELIESLPSFDVTLFLSVFHHMLTASEAYDWNKGYAADQALRVVATLREKTNVLVFEMGYPDEGYEWCQRLPEDMLSAPQDWIIRNIFGTGFTSIYLVSSPAYEGIIGRIRQLVTRRKFGNSMVTRVIRRLLSADPRDGRDIFIGVKHLRPKVTI
ncbi:MAG: methyltransferase domain-containing protein [Candidatus Bathyarchaeia archaeon]